MENKVQSGMLSLFPDDYATEVIEQPKKTKVHSSRMPKKSIELAYVAESQVVNVILRSNGSTNTISIDELHDALSKVTFAMPIVVKTTSLAEKAWIGKNGDTIPPVRIWTGIEGKMTPSMIKEIKSALGVPQKIDNKESGQNLEKI